MENFTTVKNVALATIAAAGSTIIQHLGGWDTSLKVLICFMAIDYLTGFMVACIWHKSRKTSDGTLDSRAGAKGLARKMMILVFVALGAMLDQLTGSDFFRDMVCLFYVANEGLSILENTAVMGVPYPRFVQNALEIMKQRSDEPEEANHGDV